jgi:YVTN family beta-propeller protein
LSTKDFSITDKINVGITPSGIAFNKKHSYIIVANRDANTVEVYDDKNYKLLKKISVGKHPYGISSKGDFIFTANVYDDSISIININNWNQKNIKVGLNPYSIISHNKRAYVTNAQGDSVSVIDLLSFKEIKKIKTGETPENMSIDLLNNRLIVANWGADSLSIIDLVSEESITEIKSGLQSRAFGQFIYTN